MTHFYVNEREMGLTSLKLLPLPLWLWRGRGHSRGGGAKLISNPHVTLKQVFLAVLPRRVSSRATPSSGRPVKLYLCLNVSFPQICAFANSQKSILEIFLYYYVRLVISYKWCPPNVEQLCHCTAFGSSWLAPGSHWLNGSSLDSWSNQSSIKSM